MSVLKPLNAPYHLQLLRALHLRSKLSPDNEQYLKMLEKGYEGESRWCDHLQQLPQEVPILYDLMLEVNHTHFQIDALCLTQHNLVAFEVKNYSGDFMVQSAKWYSPTNKEIKNPLLQIERNETLLQQFLTKHQLNIAFEYFLIFVHPEFMLYDNIKKQNVILPQQIPRLLRELKQAKVQYSSIHTKIVDTLLSQHIAENVYVRKIEYTKEDLLKGVVCRVCKGQMGRANKNNFICSECRKSTSFNQALSETINDFIILHPLEKITTKVIHDWSAGAFSGTAILHFLQREYKINGGGNHFYYN